MTGTYTLVVEPRRRGRDERRTGGVRQIAPARLSRAIAVDGLLTGKARGAHNLTIIPPEIVHKIDVLVFRQSHYLNIANEVPPTFPINLTNYELSVAGRKTVGKFYNRR